MGVSSILSVRALSDDSFLVAGLFYDTATLGDGETNETSLVSAGECDVFLAKYSSGGTLAWAKRAGGTNADGALAISVLSDNSCLIGGHFEGTAVFGKNESNQTSLTSAGEGDMFLAKYNTDGTLAWAKRAGGTSNDAILGVSTFSDGSCSVTGSFCGTATFGKGETNETSVTSAGSEDIFVAQYADDGTLTWVVRAGGAYRDAGQCIVSLSGDTCVVGGVFLGTAAFNEDSESEISLDTTGSYDIFLAKYRGSELCVD
jgi:hypothetical protein